MKLNKELADKPSDLIEQALVDLEKTEKDPRYRIYMLSWHSPDMSGDGGCLVCFAGAVMAQGGVPFDMTLDSSDFHDFKVRQKLNALNLFRLGMIGEGLDRIAVDLPEGMLYEVHVPHYDKDPISFKKAMSEMAVLLRARGL
jgi:hypothetical protein